MIRRTATAVLFGTGLFALGLGGCARKNAGEPAVARGEYRDTPEELRRLWNEVLQACQRDDRPRVHALMASFIMTQDELGSLLGPPLAQRFWARYQAMMGSLAKAGAVELVAHVYEKKYDDIAVARIDSLPAEAQTATDRTVAQALVQKTPFYTVRVKRHDEASGLRYDFFVYRNGYWRSGNLLGKYLGAADAAAAQNR